MKPICECTRQITEDDVVRYYPIATELFNGEELFIAIASGSGMTAFGIDDDDKLFFVPNHIPKSGDIVMVSVDNQAPMIRQILFSNEDGPYLFHASGKDPRDDVFSDAPAIYGVLAYILKKVKGDQ